jgi:hypothetical protein
MIKLSKILNELGPIPQNAGIGSPLIKLVFWDDKVGLKDPKKVKEILRVLERNLKIVRPTYNISPSEIMNSFKYFSATDKLIGNYPKNLFFDEKARRGPYSVNMRNCRFDDELLKVSKTLEVKQKTV